MRSGVTPPILRGPHPITQHPRRPTPLGLTHLGHAGRRCAACRWWAAREAAAEPVFLTRRGRRVAAVIDAGDLERLTQAAEDLADIEAADAARAEIAEHGTIPWDEVKADLGLA